MLQRILVGAALIGLIGCARPTSPPVKPVDSGVKINAPGVNVDVKDNGGVKVDAPGVDIKVNPK